MFRFLSRKSASMSVLDALDYGGGITSNMVRLNPLDALSVAAVFAARRVIAEDVAKLPAKLKRDVNGNKDVVSDAPEHVILSQVGKPANDVDDGFTAMEWIEAVVADAAFRGFGVAHLNRMRNRVREVTPIPFGCWDCRDNRWRIKFRDGWQLVPREELFVLRGPNLGEDVTFFARQAIDLALKIDAMMTSIARKSGRPNGVLLTDKIDSTERAQTLIDRIKTYFGPSGEGGVMPLDFGNGHFLRVSLTPEELEQNQTYARAVTQIASAYRVQPARLMQEITEHNNASAYTWNVIHVQDCILPWVKRFKQSFAKDVLGPELVAQGLYCDISIQGLMQGAPKERGEYYLKMRSSGAMSPRTVAQLEDLPTDGLSADADFPLLTNPKPSEDKEDDV